MTQIKNRFDIQNQINDEGMTNKKQLPNFFTFNDEISVANGLCGSLHRITAHMGIVAARQIRAGLRGFR